MLFHFKNRKMFLAHPVYSYGDVYLITFSS